MSERGTYRSRPALVGGMRGRGSYEAQQALVGASGIFGTGWGADPLSEIHDVDRQVGAFGDQLVAQLPVVLRPDLLLVSQGGPPSPAVLRNALGAYYAHVWLPWKIKWNAYRDDKTSTFSKILDLAKGPALIRDAYFEVQKWRDQLKDLWARAEAAGFRLEGPSPEGGDKSIGEHAKKAAEKLAEGAGDVWKFVKYGAWAALGLGVVVALSSVTANLRKGEDPAGKWFEYAGRGARRGAEMVP